MPSKKKLLYVITQGTWGGAQQYVYDCATAFCDTYDVTIAVGEPNGKKDLQKKVQAAQQPIRIIELAHLVRPIQPIHDIRAVYEMRKLFQKETPDIIHLNSSKAGIIGSCALLFSKKSANAVYTVHGWVFLEPIGRAKQMLYRILERLSARVRQHTIVLSKQDEKIATKTLHIPSQTVHYIPLALASLPIFAPRDKSRKTLQALAPQPLDTESFWIGCVANFFKTKGVDILIESFASAVKQYPETTLILIGDGPERNNIKKQIKKNGLEHRVSMLGYIEQASTLLRAFDSVVIPSRKEGLPYLLLEAALAGMPIIATDVAAFPISQKYIQSALCRLKMLPRSETHSAVRSKNRKATSARHFLRHQSVGFPT